MYTVYTTEIDDDGPFEGVASFDKFEEADAYCAQHRGVVIASSAAVYVLSELFSGSHVFNVGFARVESITDTELEATCFSTSATYGPIVKQETHTIMRPRHLVTFHLPETAWFPSPVDRPLEFHTEDGAYYSVEDFPWWEVRCDGLRLICDDRSEGEFKVVCSGSSSRHYETWEEAMFDAVAEYMDFGTFPKILRKRHGRWKSVARLESK